MTTVSADVAWTFHSDHEVRVVVPRETAGPGELRGYRAVWHTLRLNHHIHVPREVVAIFFVS